METNKQKKNHLKDYLPHVARTGILALCLLGFSLSDRNRNQSESDLNQRPVVEANHMGQHMYFYDQRHDMADSQTESLLTREINRGNNEFIAEFEAGDNSEEAYTTDVTAIDSGREKFIESIAGGNLDYSDIVITRQFRRWPLAALKIFSPHGVSELLKSPRLRSLYADRKLPAMDFLAKQKNHDHDKLPDNNWNLINVSQAWQLGATGKGTVIAIGDTGVVTGHPAIPESKIVGEVCHSAVGSGVDSLCPNGTENQSGAGAARSCNTADNCLHGTAVSGIAAGNSPQYRGVAPDSELFVGQIYYQERSTGDNYTSDGLILAFLEDVLDYKDRGMNVVVVNISAGVLSFDNLCEVYQIPFDRAAEALLARNVNVVVAGGNEVGIHFPACSEVAIGVAATDPQEKYMIPSRFSEDEDIVSLGNFIEVPTKQNGELYMKASGTSMASPTVSGVVALIQSRHSIPAGEIAELLKTTGILISAPQGSVKEEIPLVNAGRAIAEVNLDSARKSHSLSTQIFPLLSK